MLVYRTDSKYRREVLYLFESCANKKKILPASWGLTGEYDRRLHIFFLNRFTSLRGK